MEYNMDHMEVVDTQEKAIEAAARELFKLTILAEEERISKIEINNSADFSFRREYFQKAIQNLL
jgi:hypothetical protein